MARRIVIVGGPHVGKTTLSEKLKAECGFENAHHSDDIKHLDWSESSEFASHWFDSEDEYIAEGVQMARALRKWLDRNPGKPLDADIVWLTKPQTPLLKGQVSMAKGVMTVLNEIRGELEKRGARIHHLREPDEAINLFLPVGYREANGGRMPKFKLKGEVAKLDEVYESYRPAYVEKDGKFVLDPAKLEGVELDDPRELSESLRKEREARAQTEKELKAELAKVKDIDPAKYAELLAKQEADETDELKSKGKIDELLKKQREPLEQKLADQKKTYEDTIASLNAELDRVTIEGALRGAYEKAGVLADRMDDAIALTRSQAKREDGKLVLHDTDGLKLDISLDAFAKEVLFSTRPYLFQSTQTNGTGAQNGTNGAGGKKQYKRSDLERQHPGVAASWMKEVSAGQAELVDQ